MARYIDADAIITKLKILYEDEWNRNTCTTWANSFSHCEEIIEEQPTADVRDVLRGKWIAYQDGKYHCSRCDDVAPKGYRWNYCPNCGADMRGVEDDS